jgi:predicted dienelactone hydrolase
MRLLPTLLAALAALAAAPAVANVGYMHLEIPDPTGKPLEIGIWYPSDAPATDMPIETERQHVAVDGAVRGSGLPLVLMSHGHGGSFAGHFDTAIALAEAGYVAAAVTHNGDSWHDASHAAEIWNRPRQLKLMADYLLSAWAGHDRLDAHRIGAFGFSAGGFTVLAAAGGEPDLGRFRQHCVEHPGFEDCRIVAQAHAKFDRPIVWVHDARIRAVVSAAPALGFAFGKAGLAGVKVPVQLWRAEDDQVLPQPYYAEAVREDLPGAPEMRVVPHAGHYDFIPPCSDMLRRHLPIICVSETGFDRAAFHRQFNRDVVHFFDRTLR